MGRNDVPPEQLVTRGYRYAQVKASVESQACPPPLRDYLITRLVECKNAPVVTVRVTEAEDDFIYGARLPMAEFRRNSLDAMTPAEVVAYCEGSPGEALAILCEVLIAANRNTSAPTFGHVMALAAEGEIPNRKAGREMTAEERQKAYTAEDIARHKATTGHSSKSLD